jgi:hypothetical protein
MASSLFYSWALEGIMRIWRFLSRENRLALLLCLILIALVIFTASDSPLWIYQGF